MIEKIRSIIVEDEPAAYEALVNYLQKYCPKVEILGHAADFRSAVPLIYEQRPELVFLDVEMPYGNAFDVLDACRELHFETIFVTAFSEYSLRALNQSAAYYLLKPIAIEELVQAVDKVTQQIENKVIFNRNKVIVSNFYEKMPVKQQVILPTLEGFEVVKMEEIVRLKGNGNFTDIYLADGSKRMVCRFLRHFTEMLPFPFVRVHRSHVINVHCVKAYNKGGFILMNDGSEVELSVTYKEAFLRSVTF